MAGVEEVESLNLEYQKIKELFEDKDSKFFDTILLNGPMQGAKNKLKFLRDEGIEIHSVFRSLFHYFYTNQTLNYLEFID